MAKPIRSLLPKRFGFIKFLGQIGAFRPSNFDETFKNVFYEDVSTIPGAGLPMAIIISKLAFERIEKYR